MQFRDENYLLPKIIQSSNIYGLQREVLEFCKNKDIIDLQYSSHYDLDGKVNVFSVFILYRDQEISNYMNKGEKNV